ncbi:MAG: hypothetical protein NXI31_16070 [bacterium]|nr:hypothetical protein [bacterium]
MRTATLALRQWLLPLAAGFVLAAPAVGQFINRAAWLGIEEEGIQPGFRRGPEYYLDRMSYVVLPPWWRRGLPLFQDQVYYRVGSVTGREFTIEGGFDHAIDLGQDVTFRYHLLQAENRDARFLRNTVELELPTGETSALFAGGELFQDKSVIDASFGAWLFRENEQALRVMVTAVDAPSNKSQRVEYRTDPWAIMLSGAFGDPESHRIVFDFGAQLPLVMRDLMDGSRFEMQRWIGSFETHLRLGERDWLVLGGEIEWTDKTRRDVDPARFRRDFRDLRVEWWRDGEIPWSVGIAHFHETEDDRRPGGAASSMRMRRDEWFGIGRIQMPVADRWFFEPQVFAGNVRRFERGGMSPEYVDRFEGKVAFNARYDFSERATISFIVSTQLDAPEFGGGGVQFVARF